MPDSPSTGDDPMRIRDQIEAQVASDPAVTMVDIGAAAEGGPAIRVHVRSPEDAARLRREGLPSSVEGVPVALVVGEYRLQGPPG